MISKKIFINLIAIPSVIILVILFLFNDKYDINLNYIIHKYRISENKEIIVDNYDCGATCSYNTTVSIKKIYKNKQSVYKVLFSCEHVRDIELGEITYRSARIIKIDGLAQNTSVTCRYKIGDLIKF